MHTRTWYDPGIVPHFRDFSKVCKWRTQNDILIHTSIRKYRSANHKRPVYSNIMRTFPKWTLCWQAPWRSPLVWPLPIITGQAVVAAGGQCSWSNVSAFQLRTASRWANRLCVYHDMDFFMPPPLGAGGIMFSGCPSVRPSEAWNTLFWPVHGSVGPPDQP